MCAVVFAGVSLRQSDPYILLLFTSAQCNMLINYFTVMPLDISDIVLLGKLYASSVCLTNNILVCCCA